LILAPTGTGKTTAAAKHVARTGSTVWLTDRNEDVDDAAGAIEAAGGSVGRVLWLWGKRDGKPNCLHPDIIERWQEAGYSYRAGFCKMACELGGDPGGCPYLASIDGLQHASNIVVTKARAQKSGFFHRFGNKKRKTVILDEDAIGLLRPLVEITREDLAHYLRTLEDLEKDFREVGERAAIQQIGDSRRIADWCWRQIAAQGPCDQPKAADVPASLRPSKAVLDSTEAARKQGRKELRAAFYRLMRQDPEGTVRNVYRDLGDLIGRAAGKVAFATHQKLFFHLRLSVPRKKRVVVLDATANPDLLQPLFKPRPVEVLCDERVKPSGRVIQFMDANGPRSYLNKIPKKLVGIIDGLGDLHPDGTIVLISHKSCVEALASASKHTARIKTAYFGALRGRNDLEPGVDRKGKLRHIACHIVAGSPKTTEEGRQQLALAVYGRSVLPFADLATVRVPVLGLVPEELAEHNDQARVWDVRIKGYGDPRMQAVYEHTVTAELTQAADRARVLIHPQAIVYLVTNEPCPRLWFAEMCYAGDLLDLLGRPRSDFEANYETYERKALELLNAGAWVCNADVCRALGKEDRGAGWRYWKAFRDHYGDALEGDRKVRWKQEPADEDAAI
jgi:hypothetical protein